MDNKKNQGANAMLDPTLENPYMNLSQKMVTALGEEDFEEETKQIDPDMDADTFDVKKINDFVTEKTAILRYVHELIGFAAKLQEIDTSAYLTVQTEPSKLITNDKDAHAILGRLKMILEQYQEMPSILDPILEVFTNPVMLFMRDYIRKAVKAENYGIPHEVKSVISLMCHMMKVRGYKTVSKFFPHEVSDMEPVTDLLQHQDNVEWQPSYLLLIWLSIIVLVPFDLSTIDSQKSQVILVKRLINIGRDLLSWTGKLKDGATVMLAKLLTRPDVVKTGETDLLLKCFAEQYDAIKEDPSKLLISSGIVTTLVEVFKTGHRDDLLSRVDIIFKPILECQIKNKFIGKSTVLKKAKVNLAQRIGCIFLKPKVAKWRYQRGSRSLAQNLESSGTAMLTSENTEKKEELESSDEEDDLDDLQYERLEFIIGYLLEGLKDDENVVRWTAAKGIGRISMRMEQEFADQIVEQLAELFDESGTDSAWHGGCLALAELCRRGLLLPSRLNQFIPVLEKALIYDINLGNHSVGTHVRDAACYVVWSFARAYSPEIMKPHVEMLSTRLIVEALFDREVNCRRAASATYQEAVGRQGNFPHGIEILTEADYFTLSNRVNAYLNVSCFVGQFPEYLSSMLQHLAFVQLRHWEPAMRQLASQSLAVLCVFDPALVVTKVLMPLTELCFNQALHVRHGAVLGVSEIIIGLSGHSVVNRNEALDKAFRTLSLKERNLIKEETDSQKTFKVKYAEISTKDQLKEALDSTQGDVITSLVDQIEKKRLYRGKGGEIMRAGVCHLIHAMSTAKVPFNAEQLKLMFKTLHENIRHTAVEIQEPAAKGLESFCQTYFMKDSSVAADEDTFKWIISEIQAMFKSSSDDENIAVARGYNMAFGSLSVDILLTMNVELIDTVLRNCVSKGREQDDADTRKQAIKSLQSIVDRISLQQLDPSQIQQIFDTIYTALNDYTCDRRGDVGSWVREQAMLVLTAMVTLVLEPTKIEAHTNARKALGVDTDGAFFEKYIGAMLQQLMEKIDSIREVAGRQLQHFFKFTAPHTVDFAEKETLSILFTQQYEIMGVTGGAAETLIHDQGGVSYLPWRSAEFVFDQIIPFFDSVCYSDRIFTGLVTSSGGLTESTLKASQKALFTYLSAMKGDLKSLSMFMVKLQKIFEANLKDDRVTIPLMKTIEMLLSSDYFSNKALAKDFIGLHTLCVSECSKSKAIVKLMAAVGVFSNMLLLEDEELAQKALKTLLFLLFQQFPNVRKTAAEKLYTSLLTMEDYLVVIPGGDEDIYDEVIELLGETEWVAPQKQLIASVKPKIYKLFGLEAKAAVAKPSEPTMIKTD